MAVPPVPLFIRSSCFAPERRDQLRPGCSRSSSAGHPKTTIVWWNTSGLPGSWGVLSYLCPVQETPAAPHLPLSTQQGGVAPATSNTKATTMILSRLIHTASVPAVYASRFGFPYTGKTRFRSGDSPYRMGLEPIRLLQRISNVALSPPIPTLQALPGATMFIFFHYWLPSHCKIFM